MPYRVVVWGTGNVGAPAIRTVVNHPDLELAGVMVHSAEKEGVDAGELVGIAPTGVRATRDAEAVLAAQPDALVHAVNQDFRPVESWAEMTSALEAGIDVVTAGTYGLLHPPSAQPELRDRFEAACRAGDSSFLTSGIDPGFAIDLLPVVLSGVCESIDQVRIVENFNYAGYRVPDEVLAIIGFGNPMDQTPMMLLPGIPQSVWGGGIRTLAGALGVEIDELREVIERHPLERDVEIEGRRLAAGTQGAFRFEVQGISKGRPVIVLEHITRIVDDTAPQWPTAEGQGYHRVEMRGRPDVRLTIESEGEGGSHVDGGNTTAAARLVHAIPFVCEAPAGLLSGADLPLIAGRGFLRAC